MKLFFESLGRLHPPAQLAAIIGLFAVIFLVAINPLAAASVITFLAGLAALFNHASIGEPKEK